MEPSPRSSMIETPYTMESNSFSSSDFLKLNVVKGKKKLEWRGSPQNLQSFLRVFLISCKYSEAQAEGVWSAPNGNGTPLKGTFSDFVCTWYAEKYTLLLQGKRAVSIRSELMKIHDRPIMIDKGVKKSVNKKIEESQKKGTTNKHLAEEKSPLKLEQVCNGMVCGKAIKLVIASKLKEWSQKKSKIIIVTPFLDSESLCFLVNSIPDNYCNIEIYVRKDCGWDCNIEGVLNQSKHYNWIVKHIHAVNRTPSFHAKFLAGIENDADMVLTSCNITKDHLDSDQLETLERKIVPYEEFDDYWMKPLMEMCEGNTVEFISVDELSSRFKGASLNE